MERIHEEAAERAVPAHRQAALGAAPGSPSLELARAVGNRAMGRILARTPTAAQAMVSRHTSWNHLDRAGIAREMVGLLPADPTLFEEVFAAISWNARDDVAVEIVSAIRASPDPQARVNTLAAGGGRHALLRVVRELQAGYTTGGEAHDMQQLLGWLEQTSPTISRYGADTLEVEVITFEHGFAPLDWAGQHIFGPGARGHTAIIVGGLAYSFDEGGWEVGETKAEYMAHSENVRRDGVGQVLDVSMHDARVIQGALDQAANKGVYLLGGDVCSDATGRALNHVLNNLTLNSNPQSLRSQLAGIPLLVVEERHYHNGGLVPAAPPAPPALPPGAPDLPPTTTGAGALT